MKRITVVLTSMSIGALLAFGLVATKTVIANTAAIDATNKAPQPARCVEITTSDLIAEYTNDSALRQALDRIPEQTFLRCS